MPLSCALRDGYDEELFPFHHINKDEGRGRPGQGGWAQRALTGPSLSDFRISLHSLVLLWSSLMRLLCWAVRV